MTEVDQDRATCYHEAAHAVFAVRVCGGDVRYVDADEAFCASRFHYFGGWADSWRTAMHALAGWFAEQLAVRDEIRPESWEVLSEAAEVEVEDGQQYGDRSDLMDCLNEMGDSEEEYQTVIADTEKQVRELWPQITAVAEALKVKRRLEGDEVSRIIESTHYREEDV